VLTGKKQIEEFDIDERNRLEKLSCKYEVEGDELYALDSKGRRRAIPSPANRALFVQVEHE
jgi:hypothetical protein